MEYFITFNGQTIGPMSMAQIFAYPVTANTPVCTSEDTTWHPLYTFPDLMTLLSNQKYNHNPELINTTGKDKIACGILAIILGTLGVQYFYLGKNTAGIISIIISLFSCGLWQLVTLIQGIYMMTLTQAQFEAKYVKTTSQFPVF